MFRKLLSRLAPETVTICTYEVWKRTETRGVFITHVHSDCVDVIQAPSLQEANRIASQRYGTGAYAVGAVGASY